MELEIYEVKFKVSGMKKVLKTYDRHLAALSTASKKSRHSQLMDTIREIQDGLIVLLGTLSQYGVMVVRNTDIWGEVCAEEEYIHGHLDYTAFPHRASVNLINEILPNQFSKYLLALLAAMNVFSRFIEEINEILNDVSPDKENIKRINRLLFFKECNSAVEKEISNMRNLIQVKLSN